MISSMTLDFLVVFIVVVSISFDRFVGAAVVFLGFAFVDFSFGTFVGFSFGAFVGFTFGGFVVFVGFFFSGGGTDRPST